MKKNYISPMTLLQPVGTEELLKTSRYSGGEGDDFTKVDIDKGDQEPEPLAKYNPWATWDDED